MDEIIKCWRCKRKWRIFIIPDLPRKKQTARCPYCGAWNRKQVEEIYDKYLEKLKDEIKGIDKINTHFFNQTLVGKNKEEG